MTWFFAIYAALTPELRTTLDKVVSSQKVLLFMKGTKEFPQCGFSHTVVQILMSLNVPFETINILENDLLRQALKEYSSWPTFPQLYINGEFFGGCDITVGKSTYLYSSCCCLISICIPPVMPGFMRSTWMKFWTLRKKSGAETQGLADFYTTNLLCHHNMWTISWQYMRIYCSKLFLMVFLPCLN